VNNAQTPLLSIIIVNWKSAAYIRECIRSISHFAADFEFPFEIIVVDNTPHDDQLRVIEGFPEVKIIRNAMNVGYAKANNIGSRNARGEVLLFLNPDTEILDPSLGAACRWLLTHPQAGVVGCSLVGPAMEFQPSSIQRFPTILLEMVDSRALNVMTDVMRFVGRRDARSLHTTPVQAVSGAFMLTRRTVFESVGGFNEEYFMYAEDVDYCYRLHRAGYVCFHMKNVKVVHYGGASSRQQVRSQFSIVVMKESIFRFLKTHRSPTYAWAYRISLAMFAFLRLSMLAAAFAALGPASRSLREDLRKAFMKWRWIAGWAMGFESWAEAL
jgi:GT2 family glycosyltransferase